jgi:hypothetical protein
MNVSYVITADEPQDVLDALKKEVERQRDAAKARVPSTTGIKRLATIRSEVSALDGMIWLLENTKIEGELVRCALGPSKWGFEAAFEHAVEVLADTPLTTETPGVAFDHKVDDLIVRCRQFREAQEDARVQQHSTS